MKEPSFYPWSELYECDGVTWRRWDGERQWKAQLGPIVMSFWRDGTAWQWTASIPGVLGWFGQKDSPSEARDAAVKAARSYDGTGGIL